MYNQITKRRVYSKRSKGKNGEQLIDLKGKFLIYKYFNYLRLTFLMPFDDFNLSSNKYHIRIHYTYILVNILPYIILRDYL